MAEACMAHSHDGAQDAIEVWKVSPSFPNYAISSYGRVKRLTSSTCAKAGTIRRNQKSRDGYSVVALVKDGKTSYCRIARLVCEAFLGEPPSSRHQAAHKDADRTNDNLSNLRWATPEENEADKIDVGTSLHGSRHHAVKLTAQQVADIRASSETSFVLAERYGVSHGHIRVLKSGRGWNHPASI